MLKSSLCDYRDVYILAQATKTVPDNGTAVASNNNNRSNI